MSMKTDFPDSLVVKTGLPLHGAQFQNLAKELRSHMLGSRKKKQKKMTILKIKMECFFNGKIPFPGTKAILACYVCADLFF